MNKGFQTIEEQFVDYHAKHPEVYTELVATARRLHAKGYRKIGIAPLWEWLRLTMYLNHNGNSKWEYRFPNDCRAHYARLIMQQEPDLREFFRVRELRTA
jgi:hypothetical protein